jgi:hypothetical protein
MAAYNVSHACKALFMVVAPSLVAACRWTMEPPSLIIPSSSLVILSRMIIEFESIHSINCRAHVHSIGAANHVIFACYELHLVVSCQLHMFPSNLIRGVELTSLPTAAIILSLTEYTKNCISLESISLLQHEELWHYSPECIDAVCRS